MQTARKYRVIIAHGDPAALQKISRALEATKLFQVVFTTHSGEVCVKQALRSRPDLVIADTLLSGVDGLEVLQILKAQCPELQVILLTSFNSLAYQRAVLEQADYCIVAPYSEAVLAQRAADVIYSRQTERFSMQLVNSQTAVVLSRLCAPIQMKGYLYLHDAVQLSVHNPNILHHHTGPTGLYAQLCLRHKETYRNIERCIRSVSDHIFKVAPLAILEDHFTQADLARPRIPNLILISTLAARVTAELDRQREDEALGKESAMD